jgi:hypothetical protein
MSLRRCYKDKTKTIVEMHAHERGKCDECSEEKQRCGGYMAAYWHRQIERDDPWDLHPDKRSKRVKIEEKLR